LNVLRPVYSDTTQLDVELSCVAINGPLDENGFCIFNGGRNNPFSISSDTTKYYHIFRQQKVVRKWVGSMQFHANFGSGRVTSLVDWVKNIGPTSTVICRPVHSLTSSVTSHLSLAAVKDGRVPASLNYATSERQCSWFSSGVGSSQPFRSPPTPT